MQQKHPTRMLVLVLFVLLTGTTRAQTGLTLRADFDPTNARLPNPVNLLFSGSTDGTLNIPVAPDDPTAPVIEALNALDGFSTINPIVATFSNGVDPETEMPLSQSPIDPESVIPGETVKMFEVEVVDPFEEPDTREPFALKRIHRELEPNTDYITQVTGTGGKTLAIVPLRPLKPKTTYLVLLTSGIRAETDGTSAVPDRTYVFARYRGNHHRPILDENGKSNFPRLSDAQAQAIAQLQPAVLSYEEAAAKQGIKRGSIILSWTFTTQSINDSLISIREDRSPQRVGVANTGLTTSDIVPELFGFADVYAGTVQLPYYLEAPTSRATWPVILSTFWRDANGNSPTRFSPTPVPTRKVTVPVLLTVPNASSGHTRPVGGWPTIIYEHGISRNRLDVLTIADAAALAGFAAICIDLPLHGVTDTSNPFYAGARERTFNVDLLTDDNPLTPGPDGVIDGSGVHFINLSSQLTARDNLRQGVADLLHLAVTVPTVDINGDGMPDLNDDRLSFVGHSLGAIVGTPYVGVEDRLTAVTLSSPGGGLARMVADGSATLSPLIRAALALNGLIPGTADYDAFLSAFQQSIDSADAMNYAVAAADAYPIHMLEVVGGTELADGSPSPPDQVVPNITPGAPLSGTEPLARIMELDSIDMTTLDDDGVRGIVRFNQGNHGTFLSPASDDPEGTASLPAWLEMQLEMAFFMNSDGTTLRVTVPEVVQPDL